MLAIIALYKADDLDATDRVLAREQRVAQRSGSRSGYAVVCNFRAAVATLRGQLQTAEADARAGLEALPVDPWRRQQLIGALLDVLTETGRLDEAQSILTDNHWEDDLPDNRATNVLLSFRARLRQAQGDHQRALEDALEVRRRTTRERAVDTNWDGWARTGLLNHTLGHTAAARDDAATFLALARQWDTPAAIGQALATNGLIEGGPPGLALLAEAVKHLERSPASCSPKPSSTTAPPSAAPDTAAKPVNLCGADLTSPPPAARSH
jgi:tetratricopeptide (TPR) repeat protein